MSRIIEVEFSNEGPGFEVRPVQIVTSRKSRCRPRLKQLFLLPVSVSD